MIPVKLTIKGLYSYKEAQEIDFTQLTEASIFGIFGSVGSGKSSILEAITFALYGDTERMNKSGDDRNYNMMNLRSDELYIDFICSAGKDDNKYRFTVKGKRNRKHFEKVETYERKSYQWIPELNDWSPILVDDAAEKIIGLTYENFKRTIIIPQGRFQEFIELPLSKRTQMMNDIFQLEKYDLAPKAKILKEINEKQLENLAGKLSQIGQNAAEELEIAESSLKNTQTLIQLNNTDLLSKSDDEKKFEEIGKLFESLQLTQNQADELKKQTPDFDRKAERLKQFQYSQFVFRPLFDEKQRKLADLQRDSESLRLKISQENQIRISIEEKTLNLEKITPQFENRDAIKQEVEELDKILKIKECQQIHTDAENNLKRGRVAEDQQKEKITQLKNLKKESEQRLNHLKASQIDMERVSEVSNWFVIKNNLLKDKEALMKDANSIVAEIEKLKKEKELIYTNTFTELNPEVTEQFSSTEYPEKIPEIRQGLLSKAELLDKEIVHFSTQRALQRYAETLQPGEPCPLCGAAHHPHVLNASEDFESAILQIQNQQKVYRNQVEALDKMKNFILEIEAKIALFESRKIEIKAKWAENNHLITLNEVKFSWNEFSREDNESVKKAFDDAKKQGLTIKELDSDISQKNIEIENAQKHLDEKITPALLKLNNDIIAKITEIEFYKSQVKILSLTDFEGKDKKSILEESQKQQAFYNQIIHEFEQLTKQILEHRDKQNVLFGEISSLQKNLKQHDITLAEILHKIEEQLLNSSVQTEPEILQILEWNINPEAEQAMIDDFRKNLHTVLSRLKELEENTKGLRYDAEIHEKLRADIESLGQKLNDLRKEEGSLNAQAEKLRKDLSEQAQLLKEKEKLDIRGKDIDTLSKLFKSSGFVSYVSSMHLQNLCNQANVRFHKMTRHQLQLEIYESSPSQYDFLVRDLLNEGKTRGIKTLSGGQKFQVALSLALALADNIHMQTHSKHNFFFLDEGFGSLDKESLYEVFETLKSLRKENRIVGVISHVEDLQQEIDRFLRIRNDEERGSIVEMN